MGRRHCFIVFVFLVIIIALSGVLCAQRVIDLDKVWGDMRVLGSDPDDHSGWAVASGDINGDGYLDIIIGAPNVGYWIYDIEEEWYVAYGVVYVIFGSSNPPSTIDLSSQSADITIYGNDSDWDECGYSVASGDINGDGVDDIIIGAPGFQYGYDGNTYVIFGSSFPSPPYTIDLALESADITVNGADWRDNSGNAVASGDVNNDGYDDLIIGARNAYPLERIMAGKTYVVFGSSFPSPPYTINLSTQQADITVYGANTLDDSGWSVASGDINGDNYKDIIISAPCAYRPEHPYSGETYVIFGDSFPSPPYIIDLSTQQVDITVYWEWEDVYWRGRVVASGNINGDDYDDLILGDPFVSPPGEATLGMTLVLFGNSFPSPPYTINLQTESDKIEIWGDDFYDRFGSAVASGDVNGDGYGDIIIGAPWADSEGGSGTGKTYVIFGSSSPHSTIDFSTQTADVTICGDDADDWSGCAVASGDINRDGYHDLLIGAYYADPGGRSYAGESYLIFGGGPLVVAHGLGGKSWIKKFDIYGNSIHSFKAFGAVNSQGEVHLAVGEIDGDGHDEIAAGQGEGGKSWVKFFEVNGSPISTFKAFGATNTNGELHLTIGNFDDDTSDKEIAVAQGEGGQSWVKTFETDGTLILGFKAFGVTNAQGEVHLGSGDLNKDGIDEIIVGMGEGGSSWVKVFNLWGIFIRSFRAFDATDNPGGEVRLAVGNFNADAEVEIAVATGYNGGNLVRLFDKFGNFIREFTAFGFGANTNGDVQMASADIDNDGIDEIICGHGEGGGSWVKVFKADGTFIRSFKAFGGVNAQGEVHLGKSNY